jgi:hypothetical protein
MFGWAVLHSLWQGAILTALLAAALEEILPRIRLTRRALIQFRTVCGRVVGGCSVQIHSVLLARRLWEQVFLTAL